MRVHSPLATRSNKYEKKQPAISVLPQRKQLANVAVPLGAEVLTEVHSVPQTKRAVVRSN